MSLPEQFGLRTIETRGSFHETKREKEFGNAAEEVFIEALRNHSAIDRIEHGTPEQDEVEKTDIIVYFKGESEPVKVQLSTVREGVILENKKATLPRDVVLVHDKGILSKALRMAGNDWSLEGVSRAVSSLGKREIAELFHEIFVGMPEDKSAGLIRRIQGRLQPQKN